MPMGLLEHMAAFFAVDDMKKVKVCLLYKFIVKYISFFVLQCTCKVPRCPDDYRLWIQTMYTQFGQKWPKLHHGPMWTNMAKDQKLDTMKVTLVCINYVYSNNVCYISTSCISLVIYNILCTVGKSPYTCDP